MPKQNKKKNGNSKKTVVKKVVQVRVPAPRPRKQASKKMPKRQRGSIVGLQAAPLPSSFGAQGSTTQYNQQSMTLSGCEYLATVAPQVSSSDSTCLTSFLLNPQRMVSGSRLAVFGALWDKFKFKKLQLIYEPNVGTQTAGAICLSADPDVLDDYAAIKGNVLLQKLSSTAHNLTTPVYMPAVLNINDKRFFDRELYCEPEDGSDPRNCYAGRVWLATAGGLTSGTYGRLYLKWKVWFSNPNIDSEFEDGTAMIGANSGAYVNSTYPWGDFESIIAAYPGLNTAYLPADFVVFKSDPTLGSVIEFQAPGYYIVSMFRGGAAMGTGAFSGATFSGCSTTLPPATGSNYQSGFNYYLSNGGSTASMWTVLLYAQGQGAYISSTADSGVTHTSAQVAVSKFFMPNTAAGGLTASLPTTSAQVSTMLANLRREFETKLALISPAPALGIPVMNSSVTETATEPPDPSGAPRQSFNITGGSTISQDFAIETVVAGLKDKYIMIPRDS